MCGIAGQFLHAPSTPWSVGLRAMGQAMQYRGPDDEGYYEAPHIGLVHRRLSIRDLSPGGHCPMPSRDGRVQVVFNGEIYNWRELRDELARAGHEFATQCDTEVVLVGYQAWGLDVVPRLRGMFAVAIWDENHRQLLLARDRAGEKPLFLAEDSTGLRFASSIAAIRAVSPDLAVQPAAVACHLAHSFIPSGTTIWHGVRVLPPAHTLLIRPGQRGVAQRYWDFPRVAPSRRSAAACEKAVEASIDDSVARCLDADVPVGVFLSGGVDSSLVAALAARHNREIAAFSLGFAEQQYSELGFARQVAEHLRIPHHTVQIGVDDVLECLPHLVRQYGQPFGDPSAVPSYLVSRLARRHVKVCLSGDGGDESFGGYWRLQAGVYAHRYGSLVPQRARSAWVPALAGRLGSVGARLAALNALSLQAPGAAYSNSESWFERLAELAGPRLEAAVRSDLASLRVGRALERGEASVVQAILYDDFQVQLPDAYLTKVDVASMAASLEVRAPLLDQRVIELAWSLPDSTKLNWGRRKWLLKRLAARHVPPGVIYRPKMGFGMPLGSWFRGRLGDYLADLLDSSLLVEQGWIRPGPVRTALAAHRGGQSQSVRLWLILWLELWFRMVAADRQSAVEEAVA